MFAKLRHAEATGAAPARELLKLQDCRDTAATAPPDPSAGLHFPNQLWRVLSCCSKAACELDIVIGPLDRSGSPIGNMHAWQAD